MALVRADVLKVLDDWPDAHTALSWEADPAQVQAIIAGYPHGESERVTVCGRTLVGPNWNFATPSALAERRHVWRRRCRYGGTRP
jgi:hypothetical protein